VDPRGIVWCPLAKTCRNIEHAQFTGMRQQFSEFPVVLRGLNRDHIASALHGWNGTDSGKPTPRCSSSWRVAKLSYAPAPPVQTPHQHDGDLPLAGRIQQLLASFPSRRSGVVWGAKILGILVARRPGQRGWDSNCGVENLQREGQLEFFRVGAKILGISPGDLGAGCSPKRGKAVRTNAQRVRVRGIVEFRIRLQSSIQ
jgi:hypothetical protein